MNEHDVIDDALEIANNVLGFNELSGLASLKLAYLRKVQIAAYELLDASIALLTSTNNSNDAHNNFVIATQNLDKLRNGNWYEQPL